MHAVSNFVLHHADVLLLVAFVPYVLFFFLRYDKLGIWTDRDISTLARQAMEMPDVRMLLRRIAYQLVFLFPVVLSVFLAIASIRNKWVHLFLLLSLPVLFIVCVIRFAYRLGTKSGCALLVLIGYSDLRNQFMSISGSGMVLIGIAAFKHYLYYLPSPPWMMFAGPWCLSAGCLYHMYRQTRTHPREVLYHCDPSISQIVLCIQAALAFAFWVIGGLCFAIWRGYRHFTWTEWLKAIVFTRSDPALTGIRITGIVLAAVFSIFLGCITWKNMKNGSRRRVLLVPGTIMMLILTAGCWLFVGSNYTLTLPVSLRSEWGRSRDLYAGSEAYSCFEGEPMVLPNGSSFYFASSSYWPGIRYSVTVNTISDFSDRPYLRFYHQAESEGHLSIWVENQGGLTAENCHFQLSDRQGELKDHFAVETLRSDIDSIAPGEKKSLFTLKNSEMQKTEYGEVDLDIEIKSRFSDKNQAWTTTKELPGSFSISMRGVMPHLTYAPRSTGTLVQFGDQLQWEENIDPRYDTSYLATFYCDRTILLEMNLVVYDYFGNKIETNPIMFIYEVP